MTTRYATNATIAIQSLFVDVDQIPITNADGRVTIRRLSDDRYFNGTIFVAGAPILLVMTRVSDANAPGWWDFNFNTNTFPEDTYIMTVTDANSNAANVPQLSESIVSDALARAIEAGAAGGVGRALYNAVTSTITLYKWDDPAVILFVFDCKDENGSPATINPIFEKDPQ